MPATRKLLVPFETKHQRPRGERRAPYLAVSLNTLKYVTCEGDDGCSRATRSLSQDKVYSDVNSCRALVGVKWND